MNEHKMLNNAMFKWTLASRKDTTSLLRTNLFETLKSIINNVQD